MEIRPALADEAPALAVLGARLFRETYAGLIPAADLEDHLASAFSAGTQFAEIQATGGLALVAAESGTLWAYAFLRPKAPPCPLPFPAALEITRFYVDARFHGTGLAGRLMTACLEAAGGPVWLQVWVESPQALRFYQKQGFEDYGATSFRVGSILYQDRVLARRL